VAQIINVRIGTALGADSYTTGNSVDMRVTGIYAAIDYSDLKFTPSLSRKGFEGWRRCSQVKLCRGEAFSSSRPSVRGQEAILTAVTAEVSCRHASRE
jgi:hypothetical protein